MLKKNIQSSETCSSHGMLSCQMSCCLIYTSYFIIRFSNGVPLKPCCFCLAVELRLKNNAIRGSKLRGILKYLDCQRGSCGSWSTLFHSPSLAQFCWISRSVRASLANQHPSLNYLIQRSCMVFVRYGEWRSVSAMKEAWFIVESADCGFLWFCFFFLFLQQGQFVESTTPYTNVKVGNWQENASL